MVRRSIGDVAGLYNLLLALGAISTGVYMLAGMGFFSSYPPEWQGILPF
ncbi:hypothetical protein [Guptibacillus hwajinpoensis]|nr:hypothetical protein [Pseudalkalibacillus hwajinpoensis]WLR58830.1 hypothetical protein LC071_16930 [Pseudalkalibacillus hwajinpoensis]